jgi:hypothetical protein
VLALILCRSVNKLESPSSPGYATCSGTDDNDYQGNTRSSSKARLRNGTAPHDKNRKATTRGRIAPEPDRDHISGNFSTYGRSTRGRTNAMKEFKEVNNIFDGEIGSLSESEASTKDQASKHKQRSDSDVSDSAPAFKKRRTATGAVKSDIKKSNASAAADSDVDDGLDFLSALPSWDGGDTDYDPYNTWIAAVKAAVGRGQDIQPRIQGVVYDTGQATASFIGRSSADPSSSNLRRSSRAVTEPTTKPAAALAGDSADKQAKARPAKVAAPKTQVQHIKYLSQLGKGLSEKTKGKLTDRELAEWDLWQANNEDLERQAAELRAIKAVPSPNEDRLEKLETQRQYRLLEQDFLRFAEKSQKSRDMARKKFEARAAFDAKLIDNLADLLRKTSLANDKLVLEVQYAHAGYDIGGRLDPDDDDYFVDDAAAAGAADAAAAAPEEEVAMTLRVAEGWTKPVEKNTKGDDEMPEEFQESNERGA